MNAEQFTEYRQAGTAAKERKEILSDQVATTRVCDGTSIPLVREWLMEVQMARAYFSVAHKEIDTRKLVAKTLQGPMKRCYERFLDAQPDRNNVTWAAIKLSIKGSYLTPDEDEFLRTELEKIKQTSYETTGAYGRRFAEAANTAYAEGDRNAVVMAVVLERYIKGLRSHALKKRLIQEAVPATIDAAMAAVENYSAQDERLRRMSSSSSTYDNHRDATDEPMEVGAMYAPRDPPHQTPSWYSSQNPWTPTIAKGRVCRKK